MTWVLIALLFLLGLWGLLVKRNLIKKVMSLGILNSAVVILFIYAGSLSGSGAPIMVEGVGRPVDPVPQALMLTAIVVGICVTALALVFVRILYRRYGTLDVREIEAKAGGGHE